MAITIGSPWQPGYSYGSLGTLSSMVLYKGNYYFNTVDHTSSNDFLTDYRKGYWSITFSTGYNSSNPTYRSHAGIACFDDNRKWNFYSPTHEGAFFDTDVSKTASSALSSTAFSTDYAIVSPSEAYFKVTINGYNGGGGVNSTSSLYHPLITTELGGYSKVDGTQYYAPEPEYTDTVSQYSTVTSPAPYPGTANRWRRTQTATARPTKVKQFGKLTNTGTGYGLFLNNDPSSGTAVNAINQDYKPFTIQPTSTGEIIREATATSIASDTTKMYGLTYFGFPASYTASIIQNITFDQAYDDPPLIFITESGDQDSFVPDAYYYSIHSNRDGWTKPPAGLSCAGFFKNASGKYIGACICAEGYHSGYNSISIPSQNNFATLGDSLIAPSSYGSFTALTHSSNSIKFRYFIVSNEESVNASTSTYGLKVWDSNGNTVFSSTEVTPSFVDFNTTDKTKSFNRTYWRPGTFSYAAWPLVDYTETAYNGTANDTTKLGMCINNYSPFNNIKKWSHSIVYYKFYSTSSNYVAWTGGTLHVGGDYMNVQYARQSVLTNYNNISYGNRTYHFFASNSVSNNQINIPNHKFTNNMLVKYETENQTPIGGLTQGGYYIIIVVDSNNIKLAKHEYDAGNGTAISLTGVTTTRKHKLIQAQYKDFRVYKGDTFAIGAGLDKFNINWFNSHPNEMFTTACESYNTHIKNETKKTDLFAWPRPGHGPTYEE